MIADSVRASAEGSPLRLSYLVALAFGEGTGNQVWINIAKCGEWNGHPRGAFQFTPQVFDQIVDTAKSRVTPINCDYEHQTFKSLTGAIPSAGRILKVERRGDELWALTELTDRAASMVRAGEYRTCSPVIEFDSKDRVSGKEIGPELLSLALTNDPFQDGLHPIKLTRIAMADEKLMADKKPEDANAAPPAAAPAAPPPASAHDAQKKESTPMAAPAATEGTPLAAPPPPSAPEGSPAEENAETPAQEQGEGTADAALGAVAEAAGVDVATVLAYFADNIDKLVTDVQTYAAGSGTKADNAKAMSRINAAVGDSIRALKVELRVKDNAVVALTKTVSELEGRLASVEKQHKDEGEGRIKTHVIELQKTGYVGPEQQDQDDAIFLFTQNFERASRTYGRQIVPVGKLDADPERNDKATGPVTMDNLSDKEKERVTFMLRAGVVQDKALAAITEQRASGKGN